MDANTYGFLIGALIQVFGALIAVDAIFLILQYESIQRKMEHIIYYLGLYLVMAEKFGRIVDMAKNPEQYGECEREASFFHIQNYDEIERRIRRVDHYLNEEIRKFNLVTEDPRSNVQERQNAVHVLGSREEAQKVFSYNKNQYHKIRNHMRRFPLLIARIMGFPALLCVVFSIGLLLTDILKDRDILLYLGIQFTVISGLGFILLIYWAQKAFRE